MSDCCTSSTTTIKSVKHCCPVNGKEYTEVSARTIMHHLKAAWQWQKQDQAYYFCEDPACDVVYFGEDNSVILTTHLRTAVGIKDPSPDSLLCYCFGITRADAMHNPQIRDYVINMTKNKLCSCETSNPSGRCCLKNF